MANVGSGASGKTLIGAGNGASPTFASIGTNSGLAQHGVVLSQGNSAFSATGSASNGQLLIGATSLNPAFATLTSPDGSISFTAGANSLGLQVTAGTTVGKTITGDSGGALSPTAGNWTLAGSGSITTSGSGSTLTTQLTGLTNHSLLVGAGTSTIGKLAVGATGTVLIGNTGADPSFSNAPTLTSVVFGSGSTLSTYIDSGSWTPTLTGAAAAGTTTYTRQIGTYVKIGKLVWCQGHINASALTGTGNALIGGFPFTSNSTSFSNTPNSILVGAAGWTWPVGSTQLIASMATNDTTATIQAAGSVTSFQPLQITNSAILIYFSIVYQAAS